MEADRTHRKGQEPNRFTLFDDRNRNLPPSRSRKHDPLKSKYALLRDYKVVAKPFARRVASEPSQQEDGAQGGEGGGPGPARTGSVAAAVAPRALPRRIASSNTHRDRRYDFHDALEEVNVVEEREDARAALRAGCPMHKALAVLQCEAEESADGVFYPLISVLAAKLGFQLWGKCWLGKCTAPSEQQSKQLIWWLDWLCEGVKNGCELFIYVYSEDKGSLNQSGKGNINLVKELTRRIEEVHKAGEISLHLLVDGAEGAHLPWHLQYTTGPNAQVGWRNVHKCPLRSNRNRSTSTIVQICTNHAHIPGLVTGAFVTLLQQVEYISYIQMYRSMEVLLEESEKAVADPNRDFSTRSLSSRHRAIDPITLSIVGGAATFITALVAWQVDAKQVVNVGTRNDPTKPSDSKMARVQIKGALKRRKVQNGQRLMEGGLVFTSADFIDEDMSLMFRDWHGDLNPVWSDAAEPRPMALGKVPPGKFPQVQTPPEGSPAVSHQHGSQHFDEHTADHVPQSVFSQAPQVQPGSVEPVWQQTQPAMKLDGGQALAEPSDANLEPQLARNLPLPGRGQIAKQPRLSKYQLWP